MDEYYSNKRQDDDQWIYDPSNDVLMDEYYSNKRPFDDSNDDSQGEIMIGGGATPLLDFKLRPVSARRNWRNVLNSVLRHASSNTGMPHPVMTWGVKSPRPFVAPSHGNSRRTPPSLLTPHCFS